MHQTTTPEDILYSKMEELLGMLSFTKASGLYQDGKEVGHFIY
ncbi:Uncharacterised protein [Sphingobacterium mizutaii]|uniref:Uncharacterized protein n=1 Tax=Sphingobacterium mizutaii TaxID=1010 RepID=A0AAJ4X9J5_9SPHI|nr:hypothetical protein SAMN05192578_10939 [Sphingobacterium mizutaii]SNV38018.1 Uncharacterised protein [Sphingobacterium mizutaii]